ncbi:MAG: tetratricopeptide repeat protein [Cyanobacteria bacterium J06643_5]
MFYFKPGVWLDVPARMPEEFSKGRKLLFLLDDLNREMYRSNEEKNPKAEVRLSEPLNVPLQQRLLNALETYEGFCGKDEILVIATARNEKESQFEGETSPWEQLQWKNYPQLWERFTVYELPEPSDDAIVDVLAATIPKTNIKAKPEQYLKIASSNDKTFRNVIENLRRLKNDKLPLNPNTYRPSLGRTWEKRYKEALTRYPAAEYVYDAVDLLRQFDIPIKRFITLLTATQLIVKGNIWKRLWLNFKITDAFIYLAEVERIENPRDGQIEAKGYQLEASDYARPLFNLVSRFVYKDSSRKNKFIKRLTDGYFLSHDDAIFFYEKALKVNPLDEDLWISLADIFCNLERYEKAVTSFDKALDINALNENTWHYRGYALFNLQRYENAVASFDKALQINPLYDMAWYNKGYNLLQLKRCKEAIASFDKALDINPYKEYFWHSRGCALLTLERYKEAVASFDKALDINPSDSEIWNIRGFALFSLELYKEAINSFDKALEINPLNESLWHKRGIALNNLGLHEEAITSFNKALKIKPYKHYIWYDKACCYALQSNIDLSLDSLKKAINLNSKCREIASEDPDLEKIRSDERFKILIEEK